MGSDLRKLIWPHRVQAAILLALMIARSFAASAGITLFLPLLGGIKSNAFGDHFDPLTPTLSRRALGERAG